MFPFAPTAAINWIFVDSLRMGLMMVKVYKWSNKNVQHLLFNPGDIWPPAPILRGKIKRCPTTNSRITCENDSQFFSPLWSEPRLGLLHLGLDLDLAQDSRPSSYFPATMTNWEVDTHFSRLRKHQDSNLPGASDWSHVPVPALSLANVPSPQDNS